MRSRSPLRSKFLSHVLFPFIGIASVACGGSSTTGNAGNPPKGNGDVGPVVASAPIGRTGGTVTTPDGALTVDLPAGALSGTTEISVRERTSPADGEVGVVYEIGPTGTRFAMPVML